MKVSALVSISALLAGVQAQVSLSGYTGPTNCASGTCCNVSNPYCMPCFGNGGDSPPAKDTQNGSGGGPTSGNGGDSPSPTPTRHGGVGGGGNGGGSTPTGLTTTLPPSAGATSTNAAIVVDGSYNGGMKRFERSPAVCEEQKETGEKNAMFILNDGATLSNVIIGASQAEGVHCRGTCTLNNVWWADVCEDAMTFLQSGGTSYVNGGGALHAADKIIQFNGRGTVAVKNFLASDYGKVSRSCGNCKGNGGPRHLVLDNVHAVNGGVLCGINTNYGDTCRIANSCQNAAKYCDRYQGNSNGAEPSRIGSGPDGKFCITSNVSKNC